MKRLLRFLVAFVIVFGILSGMMFLFFPEMFYGYFYRGSRIKGGITLTIDGEKVPVSDCELKCLYSMTYPQNVKISGNDIGIKADEAGLYSFTAVKDGTELRFYFDKETAGECIRFDMDFDIDTAGRVIHYTGKYRNVSDGLLKAEDVAVFGDYSLEYEHHSIGVYMNRKE